MAEMPVFKTRHFTVSHSTMPPIPGYLIVRAIRPETSLATLTPAAQAELGKVLARAMKLIEKVVAPERVYVLRFGEEVPAIHFHVFPRTRAMADAYHKATGDATLNERGQNVLRQVSKTMIGMPSRVFQVGGHTDSSPVSGKLQEQFATNWELSTTRATNVVRFLEEQCAVPGKQLVAAGFAWHRPIASNRSGRGKRKNHRIEIVMLRQTLPG